MVGPEILVSALTKPALDRSTTVKSAVGNLRDATPMHSPVQKELPPSRKIGRGDSGIHRALTL